MRSWVGLLTGLAATVCPMPVHAVDAAGLRDRLEKFYQQENLALKNEQRQYLDRRGGYSDQTLRTRQRLEQALSKQRLEQRRLQDRQRRQLGFGSGIETRSGARFSSPGRPRADLSTLQRFERQQRQLRLEFKRRRLEAIR